MRILRCIIYLIAIGFVGFVVGRILARHIRFNLNKFPFRVGRAETRVYNAIGLPKWKDKLPDMGRLLPSVIPPKVLNINIRNVDMVDMELDKMLQETCVAELTHFWLSVFGFGCVIFVGVTGGIIIGAVYCVVGNLPCMFAQRFNRPRLIHLWKRIKELQGVTETGENTCVF